jgi:hypothetical protein
LGLVADDKRLKHFFEKNGYLLSPDPQVGGEFQGEKKLK